MLATFMIEIVFAIYIVWRYKLSTVSKLIVSLLVFLGIFQASEYIVCTSMFGIEPGTWSRLGYSAITMLPPLGIHLSMAISKNYNKPILYTAYAACAAFIGYFTLYSGAVSGATCYANYVVFDGVSSLATWFYTLYYYGLLALGILVALNRAKDKLKAPLYALTTGYLAFIIPTVLFTVVDSATIAAVPSIMCGFAVLLAFVLTLKVAPETLTPKNAEQSLFLNFWDK